MFQITTIIWEMAASVKTEESFILANKLDQDSLQGDSESWEEYEAFDFSPSHIWFFLLKTKTKQNKIKVEY